MEELVPRQLFDQQPTVLELDRQRLSIYRFKKPVAVRAVDVQKRRNDATGEVLERVVYLPILCRRAGSIRTSAGHPANLNSPLRGSTIASSLTGSNRRSRATQVKRNYER